MDETRKTIKNNNMIYTYEKALEAAKQVDFLEEKEVKMYAKALADASLWGVTIK